jgi:hypothetical protein
MGTPHMKIILLGDSIHAGDESIQYDDSFPKLALSVCGSPGTQLIRHKIAAVIEIRTEISVSS